MVFFTCNACGQAVKKNQVEKHYFTKCRNCTVLSCIDCGKDFAGDEYQTHVKCITEDEKYGGKGFQPKPSSRKGEAKQESWITNIKNYVSSQVDIPRDLTSLLNNLMNYSNVPRKQQKFKNFIRNSVHIRNNALVDQAWEIFTKANETNDPPKVDERKGTPVENEAKQNSNETTDTPTNVAEVQKHKKRKGEKKSEAGGRNEQNETLKNGGELEALEASKTETTVELEETRSKAKKKRKHKDRDEILTEAEPQINNDALQDSLSNGNFSTTSKKKRIRDADCAPDDSDTLKIKGADQRNKTAEETEGQLAASSLDGGEVKKKRKKKKRDKTNETSDDTHSFESASRESESKSKHEKTEHVSLGTASSEADSNETHESKSKSKDKKKKRSGSEDIGNSADLHLTTENGEVEVEHKKKKKKRKNKECAD